MADNLQYDVFLSHSAKDKAVVRDVAERLRKDGVKVWFDEWVQARRQHSGEHRGRLEHSRVLVLCMSANAFGSDWAQLESGTFRFRDPLNKERRFLPLRIDNAPSKAPWRFTPTSSFRNAFIKGWLRTDFQRTLEMSSRRWRTFSDIKVSSMLSNFWKAPAPGLRKRITTTGMEAPTPTS